MMEAKCKNNQESSVKVLTKNSDLLVCCLFWSIDQPIFDNWGDITLLSFIEKQWLLFLTHDGQI